jgi:hypothetical protein
MPLQVLQALIRRSTLPPSALADDVPVQRLWQDFVQRNRFENGSISGIGHHALLDLAFNSNAVIGASMIPWLSRFVRQYQGRLAHEVASIPPNGFGLPRSLSDLLQGPLSMIVPLLARAGDEWLRTLTSPFSTDGSRPRNVGGAYPIVLAAALRCAFHLDRFATASTDR